MHQRDTFRDMQPCASDVTACTHPFACSQVHPAWRPIRFDLHQVHSQHLACYSLPSQLAILELLSNLTLVPKGDLNL